MFRAVFTVSLVSVKDGNRFSCFLIAYWMDRVVCVATKGDRFLAGRVFLFACFVKYERGEKRSSFYL